MSKKKVPTPLDGIRTCTSGTHVHRASDYTKRTGISPRYDETNTSDETNGVRWNKHFRHWSPAPSGNTTIHYETVCVCVWVSQWKRVPDEWQARQATPAILQVSSSKHNAKKITTRIRGAFHQWITAMCVCVCVCVCVCAGAHARVLSLSLSLSLSSIEAWLLADAFQMLWKSKEPQLKT